MAAAAVVVVITANLKTQLSDTWGYQAVNWSCSLVSESYPALLYQIHPSGSFLLGVTRTLFEEALAI